MVSSLSEISDTPDPAAPEDIRPQLSFFRENLLYLEQSKYINIILSVIMVSNAHKFIMGNMWVKGLSLQGRQLVIENLHQTWVYVRKKSIQIAFYTLYSKN